MHSESGSSSVPGFEMREGLRRRVTAQQIQLLRTAPSRHCERSNPLRRPFHSSSPGSTGRSSIPETVMLEPRSRGVLDTSHSRQMTQRTWHAPTGSLRANGSRECAPDDRLREAIHRAAQKEEWIASSQGLLAMTWWGLRQWSFNPFHPSSPGSTGRSSIPETVVIELRGRGVLGPPLSRRTTARVWCLRCRFQA